MGSEDFSYRSVPKIMQVNTPPSPWVNAGYNVIHIQIVIENNLRTC